MTPDELGSESADLSGRLPTRKSVIQTITFLCTLAVVVGGLSLLVTLDVLLRL